MKSQYKSRVVYKQSMRGKSAIITRGNKKGVSGIVLAVEQDHCLVTDTVFLKQPNGDIVLCSLTELFLIEEDQ